MANVTVNYLPTSSLNPALARCFLKGFAGDQVNLLLAAAAWNLRKWLRAVALLWLHLTRLLGVNPSALTTSSAA